jgi:hypothetical protein
VFIRWLTQMTFEDKEETAIEFTANGFLRDCQISSFSLGQKSI